MLNDVSAFFEKGKLTSIIGVNGCGKSTLLKAILGILPLSGGEITVDGENLLTMSRNEIAKKIAYLSQGKNTPDMTVMQWCFTVDFLISAIQENIQAATEKLRTPLWNR